MDSRLSFTMLPIEVQTLILSKIGLFNHATAMMSQTCYLANEILQGQLTDEKLVLELNKLKTEEKVALGVKSERVAICLVTKFINELGSYNVHALYVFYQSHSSGDETLNRISGAHLSRLGDAHQSVKEYLLLYHANKLHPDVIKRFRVENADQRNYLCPTC